MRNILLVIVAAALLPGSITNAEPISRPKRDKPAVFNDLPPVRAARHDNSCAAYGPGFVKVEGTETCVKIGGAVSIGVGGSSGGR
jgi:porin-like protein